MADNTTINAGTGGDVIATDDLTTLNGSAVSGFKIQRVKVCYGSDASARDVDASNGLPVTGTFWQTTQPVSLSTLPALTTGSAVIGAVTQSGTWTVTQQSITKGTQGSTGVTTQDLKDAGRTSVVLNATGIVSVAAIALVTMQKYVGGTVTTGVTDYTVTTGKTLRVQKILFTPRITTASTTVTFVTVTLALRRNANAALATGSSLVLSHTALCAANVGCAPIEIVIPDGLEFAATDHIGFTQVASATTATFDVTLIGFEY